MLILLTNGFRQFLIVCVLAVFLIGCSGGGSSGSSGDKGTPADTPIALSEVAFLFQPITEASGREPWVSDGTIIGTRLLADINEAGHSNISFTDRKYAYFNNALFVTGDDGVNGKGLYRADQNGVSLLVNVRRGDEVDEDDTSKIEKLLVFNDALYIVTGYGLWISNGTATGTQRLTEFPALDAVISGNNLFFYQRRVDEEDGITNELYRVSGSQNPERVAINGELEKIAANQQGLFFTSLDNQADTRQLSFIPEESDVPQALYTFDGNFGQVRFHALGGLMYFTSYENTTGFEIWKSDGSPQGTTILKELQLGPSGRSDRFTVRFASLDEQLLFLVERTNPDSAFRRTMSELYVSSGSDETTTRLITSLEPGVIPSVSKGMVASGNFVYFEGFDRDFNRQPVSLYASELWRTDGTQNGTVMVKDINPGVNSSNISTMMDFNGTLVFIADDGSNGRELWRSDGSEEGTVLLTNINTQGPSNPELGLATADRLFFSASDGHVLGNEIWSTAGSTETTSLFANINKTSNGNASINSYTIVNDLLLMAASKDDLTSGQSTFGNSELLVSNGKPAGTQRLLDINPNGVDKVSHIVPANGFAFFIADDGLHGTELWRSDGTVEGTSMVYDLTPGESGSTVVEMGYSDGKLFVLFTDDDQKNTSLWVSDGTIEGTNELLRVNYRVRATTLSVHQGKAYFSWATEEVGSELWFSDGTIENTGIVTDVFQGVRSGLSTNCQSTNIFDRGRCTFAIYQGRLHYVARDASGSYGIWNTDGTEVGSKKVVPLKTSQSNTNFNASLLATGAGLFYVDRLEGEKDEVWFTDGSIIGTRALTDFNGRDLGDYKFDWLVSAGEVVYTLARVAVRVPNDGCSEGCLEFTSELWRFDGTPEGSQRLMVKSTPYFEFEGHGNGLAFFKITDRVTRTTRYMRTDGTEAGTFDIFEGNFVDISRN